MDAAALWYGDHCHSYILRYIMQAYVQLSFILTKLIRVVYHYAPFRSSMATCIKPYHQFTPPFQRRLLVPDMLAAWWRIDFQNDDIRNVASMSQDKAAVKRVHTRSHPVPPEHGAVLSAFKSCQGHTQTMAYQCSAEVAGPGIRRVLILAIGIGRYPRASGTAVHPAVSLHVLILGAWR